MSAIGESILLEQLNWRYAVKRFDATKKLSASEWTALEQAMVLSPSSYGLQPWKFIVVQTPELRKALRAASWNQSQVEESSHFVVFLAKSTVNAADVQHFIDRTAKLRGLPGDKLNGYRDMIIGDVVKGPRSTWVKDWTARQVYIALGQTMAAAAMINVDTCPLEGIDPDEYDRILGLKSSGYYTVCALAVGFRHQDDGLAKAKKIRFETSEVVQYR
jgi:nitroreductase